MAVTKLDKNLIDEVYKLAADGRFDKEIWPALSKRVSESTWYGWKRIGRAAELKHVSDRTTHEKKCIQFLQALKKGEAEAMGDCQVFIRRNDNWQARAWFLQRKDPERFNEKIVYDPESRQKYYTQLYGPEGWILIKALLDELESQKEHQYEDEAPEFSKDQTSTNS